MPTDSSVTILQDCSLESLLAPGTVIEGGHYVVGEEIDPVCQWSWERAVGLYARAARLGIPDTALMLLIEDFVIATDDRQAYRAGYRLPAAYRAALDRHKLDERTVKIVWEVQLRNRAHGDLRRRLKPSLTWREDGYFAKTSGGFQRRVTQGTVPVCSFIMARYIADKDRRFTTSLNVYDIKWECQSGGGVVVSRSLYDTHITVLNAYVAPTCDVGFVVRHG